LTRGKIYLGKVAENIKKGGARKEEGKKDET